MHSRHALVLLTTIAITSTSLARTTHADADSSAASFNDVWTQVASDPYDALPDDKVTLASFFTFLHDHLLAASRRTLVDPRDLLPWFRKLVHPNGICFAGHWRIDTPNPYNGYFAEGSEALVILRASTALSSKRRDQFRVFGLAVKLFPTLDPNARVRTANVFTIENLGGTWRPFALDAEHTNDLIRIIPSPEGVGHAAEGAVAARDFAIADDTLDPTQPLIRQLYPIAEAGSPDPAHAHAPIWLRLTGAPDVPRIVADDFRDELRLANYPAGLRYTIEVAELGTRLGPKVWQRIGTIDIMADAVTDSCDHRLHFPHPPFRR